MVVLKLHIRQGVQSKVLFFLALDLSLKFKSRFLNASSCQSETNEPLHDKTNKIARAPIKDSDQPGHPPSLIRAIAVRMKKAWVLSYPLNAQRKL